MVGAKSAEVFRLRSPAASGSTFSLEEVAMNMVRAKICGPPGVREKHEPLAATFLSNNLERVVEDIASGFCFVVKKMSL